MSSEANATRPEPHSSFQRLRAAACDPGARSLLFWIVTPLAALSLGSILIELLFDKVTAVGLLYDNSFGQGVLAFIDSVRVWFGRDWIRPDSWTPMISAIDHLKTGSSGDLYETLFFTDRVKFQYAPTSLLPLEALGAFVALTPGMLNAINALVLVALAAANGLLAWLVFAGDIRGYSIDRRLAAAVALLATWIFFPVLAAFHLGQIQLWIDLAFAATCFLWLTGRKEGAGAVIAAASMIKPQLGVLLLWGLLAREWKFMQGFVLAAVPIAVASIARYGWLNHIAYLDVLSFISHHGESYYANNSVNGLLNRLLFNGPNLTWDAKGFAPYNVFVYMATLATSAALVLLPLVQAVRLRERRANVLDLGAAALCFTIAAPVAWEHHYGIELPLFIIALKACLAEIDDERRSKTLRLLAVSWVLSAGTYPAVHLLAETPLNILQSYLLFGALMLLYVLVKLAPVVTDNALCRVARART